MPALEIPTAQSFAPVLPEVKTTTMEESAVQSFAPENPSQTTAIYNLQFFPKNSPTHNSAGLEVEHFPLFAGIMDIAAQKPIAEILLFAPWLALIILWLK